MFVFDAVVGHVFAALDILHHLAVRRCTCIVGRACLLVGPRSLAPSPKTSTTSPGKNAEKLARIISGTVLAGELSLMAALTSNDLVKAHMELGRKEVHPKQ